MNKCCEVFQSNIKNDDTLERGIHFYEDGENVVMQFSCVDEENKSDFFQILKLCVGKYTFNLSISGEVVIQFCPWCGTKLKTENKNSLK